MANGKIRVRLRAFDVALIDQSAKDIVQQVQKAGASSEVMDSLMKLELPAGVDVEIKQ